MAAPSTTPNKEAISKIRAYLDHFCEVCGGQSGRKQVRWPKMRLLLSAEHSENLLQSRFIVQIDIRHRRHAPRANLGCHNVWHRHFWDWIGGGICEYFRCEFLLERRQRKTDGWKVSAFSSLSLSLKSIAYKYLYLTQECYTEAL